MSTMRSPNEMLEAAREMMLDGENPQTSEEWQMVVNFFAANIVVGLEESACLLLKRIYDIPLSDETIRQIASFQIARKETER